MGHIRHDVVFVTIGDHEAQPDVGGFRASLPEDWRHLVVGPIKSVVNGDVTYAFLPDGSKTGWEHDRAGDRYRLAFIDLFRRASSWPDVMDGVIVSVNYGGDDGDVIRAGLVAAPDEHGQVERVRLEPIYLDGDPDRDVIDGELARERLAIEGQVA